MDISGAYKIKVNRGESKEVRKRKTGFSTGSGIKVLLGK